MTRLDAELLDSNPGAPIPIVERRRFQQDGRRVEFTEIRHDGESDDVVTELRV